MLYKSLNSLNAEATLTVDGCDYQYYSLEHAAASMGNFSRLPFSLKILLENLLRFENGRSVVVDDIKALVDWQVKQSSTREISFQPARVLMQDFTGVPAIVDLAAMRDAIVKTGGDPRQINPLVPVDLVIDHSVMVESYGSDQAFAKNVEIEYDRNHERYKFLKWGQQSFSNFRVVPPGTGICHQVNLEYLAQTVWMSKYGDQTFIYPDTLVGTDSHTTMVNGLGVLGWGVGGIEAEAAMLGQPISMLIPEVIGFELNGCLERGATATDLVLTITQMLRSHGVVGKFVEFYGDGLDHLSLADRATISNMAPEYGATCGIFPIDEETLHYLRLTGREPHRVKLVEAYAKQQGLWRHSNPSPLFTDRLKLDLSTVETSLAGPKRPQDRVLLSHMKSSCEKALSDSDSGPTLTSADVSIDHHPFHLNHGDVVIAAITSCTNTSNPSVMLGAGLLARNARAKGLTVKPWVKTSLAPGSQVVTDYLRASGLQDDFDDLGFNLVGYGCTTCIGNSGPLKPAIAQAIDDHKLTVAGVLSGNRNFEGRIHPQVKLNYLASPLLVVAYAIAGTLMFDFATDALGHDDQGQPVFLKDIWPSDQEIKQVVEQCVTSQMFNDRYAHVFTGDTYWQNLQSQSTTTYAWDADSTYVKMPPYFDSSDHKQPAVKTVNIQQARILGIFGDSITTDHISPAGSIKKSGPAGQYLESHGIPQTDFNSYGARRGNHEVMMRGTFANIRLQNEMTPKTTGGVTRWLPHGDEMTIFDAAMRYQVTHTPLVIVAGREYGTGSSRDWAAKGTYLLGVKAVIAESFERIHRSNLVGMGVLPLEFLTSQNRQTWALTGNESIDIVIDLVTFKPKDLISCRITDDTGTVKNIQLTCRIDTADELAYFTSGGILHYVLKNLAGKNQA